MKITNIKPFDIIPDLKRSETGNADFLKDMEDLIVNKVFTPLSSSPVKITDDDKNPVTEDNVLNELALCMEDAIDADAEKNIKEIFEKSLIYYNPATNLRVNDIFGIRGGTVTKLPEPDDRIKYTPATDIIPISKGFLGGTNSYDELFTTFFFYAKPETLGFYFANEAVFNEYKDFVENERLKISQNLSSDVNALFSDFKTIKLNNLTESLVLRQDDTEFQEEYSFPRTLIRITEDYIKGVNPSLSGIMPFNLGEYINPRTVTFINIEMHSMAKSKDIKDEWNDLNDALGGGMKIMSLKKIRRLMQAKRSMKKAEESAARAMRRNTMGAVKSSDLKLRRKAFTGRDMGKLILRIVSNLTRVNKSENIFKTIKSSFMVPNRRDPDDFNRKGKMVSTSYKPDIHLYIDASGSISEENFEDSVKTCIKIAKELNVNLYYNTFSHYISQGVKLDLKDKSLKDCYREFLRVPRVGGGTDFKVVWDYINASPKRRGELSLMVTDFGYIAPNFHVKSPKRLYYIPCSKMDWNIIKKYGEGFMKSMVHIEPNIRKKILG